MAVLQKSFEIVSKSDWQCTHPVTLAEIPDQLSYVNGVFIEDGNPVVVFQLSRTNLLGIGQIFKCTGKNSWIS
jgi:hypothetical protein